ncbi:MAG: hypothetical protein GF311_24515 [Candidatus Lokiarchaeota archaeon]|nr:hypothetical protein [Candidatus Lokiarchaeota archaeon]
MITYGLIRIIELCSNEIHLFYNNIDNYFKQKIHENIREFLVDSDQILNKLLNLCHNSLSEFGFRDEEIESHLCRIWKTNIEERIGNNADISKVYKIISPFLYEIFIEKLINYLVDNNSTSIMEVLKSEGFLSIEFIIELKKFKELYDSSPTKKTRLRKYLKIRDKIIQKLINNKWEIENLQNLDDPRDRLQLSYMIFRLIDFFNLENMFDFSKISEYIQKHYDEWLDTIPLVSLKNPDLYFCGIYLAHYLKIPVDEYTIKYFLLNIYDENIDEFEAPLIEATNQVYFFFKSSWMTELGLSERQIQELLKGDDLFFQSNYLKSLETSQLVLILMIFKKLGLLDKLDKNRIRPILSEIEKRITPDGIKQYRDGFMSAEATYYVLFCKHMLDELDHFNTKQVLDKIISRIFRNLEITDLSKDINFDLITELYYACESLQLLNCLDTMQMTELLGKNLFPNEIIDPIMNNGRSRLKEDETRLRDIRVSKSTGELLQ